MKLLPVSGGSNRFAKNEGFSKYIFSSKAKMTGFKVVEKSKSCCGSRQIRILQPLRFGEKYRLSSKTPQKRPILWDWSFLWYGYLEGGFERRLLGSVQWTLATAVARPQPGESVLPHQQKDQMLCIWSFCN